MTYLFDFCYWINYLNFCSWPAFSMSAQAGSLICVPYENVSRDGDSFSDGAGNGNKWCLWLWRTGTWLNSDFKWKVTDGSLPVHFWCRACWTSLYKLLLLLLVYLVPPTDVFALGAGRRAGGRLLVALKKAASTSRGSCVRYTSKLRGRPPWFSVK